MVSRPRRYREHQSEHHAGDNEHLTISAPSLSDDFIPQSQDLEALRSGEALELEKGNGEEKKAKSGPLMRGNKAVLRSFPQKSFMKLFKAYQRYLVAHGGGGAGKSIAASQKCIFLAWKYPGTRIIVIRKWQPQLQVTCFRMLKDIINENHFPAKINNTTMKIQFGNGSEIHCLPIVDTARSEAASRLKSLTDVDYMWLEEPTELSQDEFDMIDLRLRGRELEGGRTRQIILTFNPIDRNHWLHDRFFNEDDTPIADENTVVQHYTYLDNQFVDAAYKRMLESIPDKNRYNVYTLGLWGEMGDLVYENWRPYGDAPGEKEIANVAVEEIIGGADFGYADPCAFILLGINDTERKLYVLDEAYQYESLNRDFVDSIKTSLRRYMGSLAERGGFRTPIHCDSSEPASIKEMREAGLNATPAQKNIIDGINAVRQYEIIINTECKSFMNEISGYTRQKDPQGHTLEMPNSKAGFDHLMDAMRYAVYSHALINRMYTGVKPLVDNLPTRYTYLKNLR